MKTITRPKYRRLLRWLVASREEKGLTTRQLADRLDLPPSYVTKTELAERRLDICEYVEYCEALEIDPTEGLKILFSNGIQ